jgi:hypothetical protein
VTSGRSRWARNGGPHGGGREHRPGGATVSVVRVVVGNEARAADIPAVPARRHGPHGHAPPYPRGVSASTPTCPRHPEVETRLACSACATPICPDCGHEAVIGYQCPDCARPSTGDAPGPTAGQRPSAARGGGLNPFGGTRTGTRGTGGGRPWARPRGGHDGDRLPTTVGTRATVVGIAAAVVGGLVLGPVLSQGALFLLSSGVVGWLVARAVFWAAEERTSAYLRALGLTCAGFTVAVGLVVASTTAMPPGPRLLAYPAAIYGAWICVRGR